MMRKPKLTFKFNWKYVTGEILLIFIGINLAIWFNNWNTSKKSTRDKQVAITKIREEIKNNIVELKTTSEKNQQFLEAYSAYENVYHLNTNEIITSSKHFQTLQKTYPDFYSPADSSVTKDGLYHYTGKTHIKLELADLSEIAWETTRSTGITNEFNYECLFELASLYNLQQIAQQEIDKVLDIVQNEGIEELISKLKFIKQFEDQLEFGYENGLNIIDDCQ